MSIIKHSKQEKYLSQGYSNYPDVYQESDCWKILKCYFDEKGWGSIQIETYNDFVTFGIQNIIAQERNIVTPCSDISFGNVFISEPQIIEDDRTLIHNFPITARIKHLNYDAALSVDITETFTDENGEKSTIHYGREVIGRIPIMLKSCLCNLSKLSSDEQIRVGECPNDYGGYFIIGGNERVLVSQMRNTYSRIFVLPQKAGSTYKYIAEIRSMSDETGHSVLLQCMISNDNNSMFFSLPYISQPIPIGVVFKSIGYSSTEDIINLIGIQKEHLTNQVKRCLSSIIIDSSFCGTKQEALDYIGKFTIHVTTDDKKQAYAWQVVESEILPHLGVTGSLMEIACFLGNMTKKVIYTNFGIRTSDDRDNYSNKKVDASGALCYELFRNLYKKFISDLRKQLETRKQRPDIKSIIARNKKITQGFNSCFATGNWNVQKNASYVKTGVSQILERMTYFSTLSHLRRIIIPIGKEGKSSEIRQIHQSSFGRICPAETPEGHKVGSVLNFALLGDVSKRTPTVLLKTVLEQSKYITSCDDIDKADIKCSTIIFLNGIPMGFTDNPEKTINSLKKKRSKRIISYETSISFDTYDNEIRIFCDEGRVIRPLLVVNKEKNGLLIEQHPYFTQPSKKHKFTWTDLIRDGYINYVDASEEECSVIAMYPSYLSKQKCDYCEIHPVVMLGLLAGKIPFSDHSQSPRNCFSSSMGKQAIGMPMLTYNIRTDTKLHVMWYPMRPLVSTKIADLAGINKMPSGQPVTCIIFSDPQNQEDSIMLNQCSVDLGLFCITSYQTIDFCEQKRGTYSREQICVPPKSSKPEDKEKPGYFERKKAADYSLLDENGIIRAKTISGAAVQIKKGLVLVGKITVTTNKESVDHISDSSLVAQNGDEGTIDRIHVVTSPNGYKIVKIVIRVVRPPQIGDKLASTEGQKGTIGIIYPREDMPFTASGQSFDLAINSLCITSRMTINQIIEMLLGRKVVKTGIMEDATPFTERSRDVASKLVNELEEEISSYGFISKGSEPMYCGKTGRLLKCKIFYGITYYQRLKHLVDEKMHARARGAVTMLTRQPLEGRSRDGGECTPQWYLIVLLVHVTVGDTVKNRENLVI